MMDNISSMKTFKRIETQTNSRRRARAASDGRGEPPIFQTAMFEYAGEESITT